jgi:predicted transposase/invertase (TIGR01784 family)
VAKLEYTFKTDTLFKMLFVQHPDMLKHLVAALLKIELESIDSFVIRNSEIPPEELEDKFCRLDISMTVNKERVDLEIQVRDDGDYPARALYYWAREFSTALPEGEEYNKLPRTVVISIVDFALFSCAEFHSEFAALEVSRHTRLSDKFGLYFFELPKLPAEVDPENLLELWLSLFKANTEEELAQILALGVPIMNRAIDAYNNIAQSPEFHEKERMRSRARHNEASALGNARREEKLEIARTLMEMGDPIDKIV